MKQARLLWLLSGLAIAGTTQAARPELTAQQRKAIADAVLAYHKHSNFRQPATAAEAAATRFQLPDGKEGMLVPTELWNTLSVERDAQGVVHVREHDGTGAAAAEGLPNE